MMTKTMQQRYKQFIRIGQNYVKLISLVLVKLKAMLII